MMGYQSRQMAMIFVDMESLIPKNHLLRKIDRMVSFDFIYDLLAPYYPATGRPSIDPASMFKMLLMPPCLALIASSPFVALTGFTPIVGISLNIALRLTENMVLMPVLTHILAYFIRCLFASIVEVAFCSAAWNFYLRKYIDRKVQS